MKTAIYAGSFDLWTIGHQYVVDENVELFDKLYIAIGVNPNKKSLFNLQEKIQMIMNANQNNPKIEVVSFENQFLVNFCKQYSIGWQIRGLRTATDLDFEKQISYINNKINSKIKTIYSVAPTEIANISSSLVKSLMGPAEWMFVVENLVPKINMPIINIQHYGGAMTKAAHGALYDYKTITEAYTAPGRYYHTLNHLIEMLDILQSHCDIGFFDWRKRALKTAVVWHDAVYNPLAKDNEEKSVELYLEYIKENPTSPEEIRFVTALILATKNHEGEDPMHNLFIDADLSILAAKSERFNEYERQIRAEYSMVPDALYNKGRAEFIEGMLQRPRIFLTDQFAKMEEDAKKNLSGLLERLK